MGYPYPNCCLCAFLEALRAGFRAEDNCAENMGSIAGEAETLPSTNLNPEPPNREISPPQTLHQHLKNAKAAFELHKNPPHPPPAGNRL